MGTGLGLGGMRPAHVAIPTPRLLAMVEWLIAVPALAHLWAAPEHLSEWWGYGAFFLLCGLFQGAYAITLERWRQRDWFLALGITANASMALLWLISRTAGMPRPGPESGHVHTAGLLDISASLFEVAVVLILIRIFMTLPADRARADLLTPTRKN